VHTCTTVLENFPNTPTQLGTILPEDEGWASTRVPGRDQAADQGVGSAWTWQDELVTGPVWGRHQ